MSVRRGYFVDRTTGERREFWFVDILWTYPDGRSKRIRKTSPVPTKKGAQEYERQLREGLLRGERSPAPLLDDFAGRFLEIYARVNNKPSEFASKKYILETHLRPFFGRHRLSEVGPAKIEEFKAEQLRAGLAPKTVNNQLAVLRRLLNVAREWGHLDAVPRVKALKAPRPDFGFLAYDEADRLVAAADPEWRPVILIALHTGLRRGEIQALQWDAVDLAAGRLLVKRNVWQGRFGTPKGGRTREIPLNAVVLEALRQHRHLRGPFVFCREDGSYLTNEAMKWNLARVVKRAGLRLIGWHVLRHTFASHLVMRGAPLKAVQELLGHATIEMTMRYAHLSPAAKRDTVDLLTQRRTDGKEKTGAS